MSMEIVLYKQLTSIAADFIKSLVSASASSIFREGTNVTTIGCLAASIAGLVPRSRLLGALSIAQSVEGKFKSRFMANFLGGQQEPTVQQELLKHPLGQNLVLYITMLQATETTDAIRQIMREHLAIMLQRSRAAEVHKGDIYTCTHSSTLESFRDELFSIYERCEIAFSQAASNTCKKASYKEMALITQAFVNAQQRGSKHWVRVRNLIGAESLCAALGVAFSAEITIGPVQAVIPTALPSRQRAVTSAKNNELIHTDTDVDANGGQKNISDTPIRIVFEYDRSESSITVCEYGDRPVSYIYVEPAGSLSRPLRSSMTCGAVISAAKRELNEHSTVPWICWAAIAAYCISLPVAQEIIVKLEQRKDMSCRSMMANLVGVWMDIFIELTGGEEKDRDTMRMVLSCAADRSKFIQELEQLAGRETLIVWENIRTVKVVYNAIGHILCLSIFRALFGLSYTGLEVNSKDVNQGFLIALSSQSMDDYILKSLSFLSAYNNIREPSLSFATCCSVIQCGGYVLMPRVLAEGMISGIESSPFIMIGGRLAKDNIPLDQFVYISGSYYSHHPEITDIIEGEQLPCDAGISDTIDYLYEETDLGFNFWTVEADYRLNLEGLIQGILNMHFIDDSYGEKVAQTTWRCVAPHHTMPTPFQAVIPAQGVVPGYANVTIRGLSNRDVYVCDKTIYLSFKNDASRRLALSRVGDVQQSAVVHSGNNYGRALAYADKYKSRVVIL